MLRLLFITIFSNTQTKFLGRIAQERYYYIYKASKQINESTFIIFFPHLTVNQKQYRQHTFFCKKITNEFE